MELFNFYGDQNFLSEIMNSPKYEEDKVALRDNMGIALQELLVVYENSKPKEVKKCAKDGCKMLQVQPVC